MATVTCTTTNVGGASQTRYTCSGFFCARKIKRLKQEDAVNQNSPSNLPVGEFKILQIQPGKDDVIFVGLREFSVHQYDIIVAELSDDAVEVIVFEGDDIVFRNKRAKDTVKYSIGRCYQVPVFDAFDDEEDFIQLDVRDLNERYLKIERSEKCA